MSDRNTLLHKKFAKYKEISSSTIDSSTNMTLSKTLYSIHDISLVGDTTFTLNMEVGENIVIFLRTGSNIYSITWQDGLKWLNGVILSLTTNSYYKIIIERYNANTYIASWGKYS